MKKMLRILMLNYEFPPIGGGAGNANYYLLKEFSKNKNIAVDLITSSKGNYKEEKFSKNIRLFRLNVKKKDIHFWTAKEAFRYTVKSYFFTRKLLKREHYDMIHTFFALPTGMISFKLDLPVLISLRGSDVPGFNQRFKQIESFQRIFFNSICKNADLVVANSYGLKQLASLSFDGNIGIIPNGIDTKQFSPSKQKSRQIICVARLIERKGLNYLIEAMPKISGEYNLLIIGEGPEKENLMRLAKSNGSIKRIKFLDYVKHDDLPNHYNDSEIFILPSLYEGMSNTILEAMSSGLPIITTDTGGSRELIDQNGIIIEKKSSVAISNAINTLIDNDILRKEFSINSRKRAVNYSWKKVAQRYLESYKKIIAK